MDQTSSDDSAPTPRYGYFVLQARAASDGDAGDVAGVMEDLTTGDKREFASAVDMARLLAEWAQRSRTREEPPAP